jgi:uracil phosphoribosyltransferase
MLLGYEVTRFIPAIPRPIQTPLEAMVGVKIKSRSIVLVPILRAGLGFLEGMRTLIPFADVGHIGLYRDEKTRRPVSYYVRLPKVSNQRFIILDPMMATGNSACAAISMLLDRGVPRRNIIFMALVVAPEGVRRFNKNFSDIPIIAACLDRCLDKRAYIRPGLGDAGDRLFGTP